ncbi:MAG: hypothetical protein NUV51_01130, partial [Sulfuricaulis sp.]|nr:hypothetical protein [Sulfuricaulis sp.]
RRIGQQFDRTPMEHPDLIYCRTALKGASLQKVSEASGGEFSRRWLTYIRDGQIDNPGIQNILMLRALIQTRPELFPAETKAA